MHFTVLRPHQGDRFYASGDVREARESDVQHLVARGVLAPVRATKAEPKVLNKAERKPANKSAG